MFIFKKQKISMKNYLSDLNWKLDTLNSHLYKSEKLNIEKLNCNTLAEHLLVTPATISNLNTDSKFSLLSNIADEICFHYADYFKLAELRAREEYPDEYICYNYAYVLHDITSNYTIG